MDKTDIDKEREAYYDFLIYGTTDESLIEYYKEETDSVQKKIVWEYVIQVLPQSFLQKRTVMMSYAALRNIYRQREGHKLKQWHMFRKWIERLPESWMITE